MATVPNSITSVAKDYGQVRTVPAAVSGSFLVSALYGFEAITPITFRWIGVTMQPGHVLPVSAICILVAFASSETRNFMEYASIEQALIVMMIVITVGWQWTPPSWWAATIPWLGPVIRDLLLSIGYPAASIISTVISAVGWVVLIN